MPSAAAPAPSPSTLAARRSENSAAAAPSAAPAAAGGAGADPRARPPLSQILARFERHLATFQDLWNAAEALDAGCVVVRPAETASAPRVVAAGGPSLSPRMLECGSVARSNTDVLCPFFCCSNARQGPAATVAAAAAGRPTSGRRVARAKPATAASPWPTTCSSASPSRPAIRSARFPSRASSARIARWSPCGRK